jgi:capsular exopolysaccharide synthesis family protein
MKDGVMETHEVLRLLRRSLPVLLVCACLGAVAAGALTLAMTPLYRADTTLLISARSATTDPAEAYQANQLSQQLAPAYARLATSRSVAAAVVGQLGLRRPVEEVRSEITAKAVPDTNLLSVSVTDPSAAGAQRIANAVGTQLGGRIAKLESSAGSPAAPAAVLLAEPAQLPGSPVSPRPALNVAIGMVLGFGLGAAAVVLRRRAGTVVDGWTDLERQTGVPCLGIVTLGRIGGVPPPSGDRRLPHADEAYRQLRTNLEGVEGWDEPRSVLVTSAAPEEGRTTVACNLALTFAQAGRQVALVEADLRRPRVAIYLGLAPDRGLLDVLRGNADVEQVERCWCEADGGVCVVTAGQRTGDPTELLRSRDMGELMKRLEARFDLVVLDGPPVLTTADAAILARRVHTVLLVARHEQTRPDELAAAMHSLDLVGARPRGAVLTVAPGGGRWWRRGLPPPELGRS